jgi:hypothetical protein
MRMGYTALPETPPEAASRLATRYGIAINPA